MPKYVPTKRNLALGDRLPDYNKLAAWQLKKLGYTYHQVATTIGCSIATIQNWCAEVDECYADMPAVRLMIDRVQTAGPKALQVLIDTLDSPDKRLRYDAATKILISLDVIKDRRTEQVVIDGDISDAELVAKVERIFAQSSPKAGTEQLVGRTDAS